MVLEAFATALACLCTTTVTMSGNPMPKIMMNSFYPLHVANSTDCPMTASQGLFARIQYMTYQLQSLRSNLNEVRKLIYEYNMSRTKPSQSHFVKTSLPEDIETPRNCINQKHGQVRIQIAVNVEPFYVNCDQQIRDGGWLVVAYRFDGSEDFNRNWYTYKSGFGALNSEFFIGLEKLYQLTNNGDHELLIIMQSMTGDERFALYNQFSIGSEAEKYLLYVLGTYRGDAGDSLSYHAGKKFTTFDQDNDDNGQNCARTHAGGWWYGRVCFESNLFGTFQFKYGREIGHYKGILWKTFVSGPTGSLRNVRILIRPYRK